MSKIYKHDEEIKEENGLFLKGYKVSYYYNDQIKETYTYLNNINIQDIQESHEKECESDASDSDDASLNDVSINEEQKDEKKREQKDEKKREQKEGRECNNINVNDVNVKELLKSITSHNKINDGLNANASKETNKNVVVDIANTNKKQIVNNLIRNKADAHAVPIKPSENKCGKEKPKLNVNKIKNIIDKSKNENRDNEEKGVSIQDKIYRLIKKINNKIKSEVVKEWMEYENVVENEIKNNKDTSNDDEIEIKMNAFYHYILNKINSKI
jgi:hypothetical protein